jgi:hypothetical protein
MDPVESLGYRLGLVGLEVTDKMPDQIIPAGLIHLHQPFLDEIFAEIALAG